MRVRRRARELALRALYTIELAECSVNEVIHSQLYALRRNEHIFKFCVGLIRKTHENRAELDVVIQNKAKNWDFKRIAIIDRIILRIALCEFLYFNDIPPKVSIDEAIEISKKYSTEKSGKFINGILDSVLTEWKSDNKIKKIGRGLFDL